METSKILSDKEQLKQLARALKHVEKGKLYSHQDVFGHKQPKAEKQIVVLEIKRRREAYD